MREGGAGVDLEVFPRPCALRQSRELGEIARRYSVERPAVALAASSHDFAARHAVHEPVRRERGVFTESLCACQLSKPQRGAYRGANVVGVARPVDFAVRMLCVEDAARGLVEEVFPAPGVDGGCGFQVFPVAGYRIELAGGDDRRIAAAGVLPAALARLPPHAAAENAVALLPDYEIHHLPRILEQRRSLEDRVGVAVGDHPPEKIVVELVGTPVAARRLEAVEEHFGHAPEIISRITYGQVEQHFVCMRGKPIVKQFILALMLHELRAGAVPIRGDKRLGSGNDNVSRFSRRIGVEDAFPFAT